MKIAHICDRCENAAMHTGPNSCHTVIDVDNREGKHMFGSRLNVHSLLS